MKVAYECDRCCNEGSKKRVSNRKRKKKLPSSKTGVKQKKENALKKKESRQFSNAYKTFFLLCLRGQSAMDKTKKMKRTRTLPSSCVMRRSRVTVACVMRRSPVSRVRRSSVSRVRRLLVCCRRARERRLRLSCALPTLTPSFVALETAAGRAAEEEKLGYGWLESAQPCRARFLK